MDDGRTLVESSISMKSRGYSLEGRTAFSICRFDNRDRSFVLMMFVCVTLTAAGMMLDQTHIYYDPEIVMEQGDTAVICVLCGICSDAVASGRTADSRRA